MGCELGKLASSSTKSDGQNALGPGEPPPPAAPDPRLPLTARQKFQMVASWKGISRAMTPTGICMFIKLFEEHGDLLYLFKNFRELKTREQQATSEELADHANKVMETLDEGIKSLENLDTFFDYLHQVGASHTRIPGFKADYFWKIEIPFLTAVETTLGDRYTENVEGIYKLTIKFIIETLVTGFEKSAKANPSGAGGAGGAGVASNSVSSTGGAACPFSGGGNGSSGGGGHKDDDGAATLS